MIDSQLNPADWLPSCTVRIEGLADGSPISVGSGFLYDFELGTAHPADPERSTKAPTVVTNKHVVRGCDAVRMWFSVSPKDATAVDRPFWHSSRTHMPAVWPVGEHVVDHPSADLCAIPIAGIFHTIERKHPFTVLNRRLWKGHHLDSSARLDIRYIEPIVMIGYPTGLWDSSNNAPIVRRGSTATHPLVRYEGKDEFLIDAACFPGSSGSPVFLYQDGYYQALGQPFHGIRTALLGILYAGPMFSATGAIQPAPIPTSLTDVAVTSVPMNLGYVISADALHEMEPLVRAIYLRGFAELPTGEA